MSFVLPVYRQAGFGGGRGGILHELIINGKIQFIK
jgi:hypothetical protein